MSEKTTVVICPTCGWTQYPGRSIPTVCEHCKEPIPASIVHEVLQPFLGESDGSTASYYQLPSGATELQDLIFFRNMNAQLGEIFRAAYRYGQASHSDCLRDARKIKFYAEAEIARLEKYGESK